MFFTDIKIKTSNNIFVNNLSLSTFNSLASNKLKVNVNVKDPYKLNDFKPAYGIIFAEYLENYDFWGFCDIDIILGNISNFFTLELLSNYDLFSARTEYPTGCFMLFRNCFLVNTLFYKSKDWQIVFESEKHFCFDECNFNHSNSILVNANNLNLYEIESFDVVIFNSLLKEEIRYFNDHLIIEGNSGNLNYLDGILTFKNEFEILLYHLIRFKSNTNFNVK